MKRVVLGILLASALLAALLLIQPVQALPEYATQTGEPCATCHISPSGGGLRTPRGQAWVSGGKLASVQSMAEALQLLGVRTQSDPSAYVAQPGNVTAPQLPQPEPAGANPFERWLQDYPGN